MGEREELNDTFELMEPGRRDGEVTRDNKNPEPENRKRSEFVFALALTLIFLATAGQTLTNHEMWRDELQACMIARDSESLPQLFRNMRYEGHPPLWHLGLYGIKHVWDSPEAMQYLHLLVAAATVFVFAMYAPLPRLFRGMFVFGYYPFYEYAVLARNYAPGFLLLMLFCAVWRQRGQRLPLAGALLFLAAMTSVHAAICVIAIIIGLCAHYGWRLAKGKMREGELKPVIIGLAIAIAGVISASLIMIPPEDTGFAIGWRTDFSPEHWLIIRRIAARTFFPLVEYSREFWGSNIINRLEYTEHIHRALGVYMILWGVTLFAHRPWALITAFTGALGLIAFFYMKYPGSPRHHGFLFIIFIVSIWLSREGRQNEQEDDDGRHSRWGQTLRAVGTGGMQNVLLFIFFAANLYGGIAAGAMDMKYTFSASGDAADYIKDEGLDKLPMVGDRDTQASAVAGHLKGNIRYAKGNRDGSFMIWDKKRLENAGPDRVIEIAAGLCEDAGVLLVLNYEMPPYIVSSHGLKHLKKIRSDIVLDESYDLYLLPGE